MKRFGKGKFKERLYRFMYGRYGTDELYVFSFITFGVLWLSEMIVTSFMPEGWVQAIVSLCFSVVITALLIWSTFRVFSKNIYKRRRENEAYIKARRAVARFFSGNTSRKSKGMNRDDEYTVFRDCTWCSSTLRLTRRAGKHKVRCPRCNKLFYVKSK